MSRNGEAAAAYALRGFRVFPLAPRTKVPLQGSNGLLDATSDLEAITRWWDETPDANVGIATGPDWFVIDVDVKHGGDETFAALEAELGPLPATPITLTGGGGSHYWLKSPAGVLVKSGQNVLGAGVDVRGVGGYICGPPSIHPDGPRYEFDASFDLRDLPLAVAPAAWVPRQRNGHEKAAGIDDVIPEGARHGKLLSLAGLMREYGMAASEIEAALLAVNERCRPPLDDAEVRNLAQDVAARYEPGYHETLRPDSRNGHAARGTKTAVRRVQLTSAADIRPRPVRWGWQDRVPAGEITSTPGRGGVGKSTFHSWMAAHITRGTLPGIYLGSPRSVIIAASEDSWDRTIVPRLMAAGADLSLVFRVNVTTEEGADLVLSLPADCDALEQEIVRVSAAMLSVDPLMSTVAGALDTHKDRDVRQALEPLARLADRTGCMVIGNSHFNKSGGTDPLGMIMGSAAFGNVGRAALGFMLDPDAEDGSGIISQVKNNLGRLDLPSLRYVIEPATLETDEGPTEVGRLVMLGETTRSITDILRDTGGDPTERNEAETWLRDYLVEAGGSAAAADALKAGKAAGFTEDTIKKARAAIKAQTQRTGFGKEAPWTWSLIGPQGAEGAQDDSPTPSASSAPWADDLLAPATCQLCDGPTVASRPICLRHPVDTSGAEEIG